MSRAEEILQQAAQLNPAEQSELLERLLENMPVEVDNEIEAAWRDEVRERLTRIRSGAATLIPWEETEQRLSAR